jgi:hypothetical protein
MRALRAGELLRLWEQTNCSSLTQRALALLSSVAVEEASALADLSIGTRDALLLELRAQTFGTVLKAQTQCPACAERLAFSIQIQDLLAARNAVTAAEPIWHEHASVGWSVRFRVPSSSDLLELERLPRSHDLRRVLLERCVQEARYEGTLTDPVQLPQAVVQELAERMDALDPCADILLALCCSGCQHAWSAQLDIVSYVWAELCVHARRLLREVDVLARTYGWRESDILGLGSARRRAYLELAGA